jgi:hypothetical protein
LDGPLFSGVSSNFSVVLTGNEREALLRVADQLSVELGDAGGEEHSGADSPLDGDQGMMAGILNFEDELLVLGMRQGLAKVAAAADGDSEGSSESAVRAALDGTELVMRGELVCGNADHLPALLPGFVFLVTLPVIEQDEALELARRTAQLIEGALGD